LRNEVACHRALDQVIVMAQKQPCRALEPKARHGVYLVQEETAAH